MNLAQGIIKICYKKGITQSELAERTGLTKTYHSLIENNRRFPSENTLKKISEAIGVPIPVIFWLSMDDVDMKRVNSGTENLKMGVDAIVKKMFL
jgi:transcriptional regulator with XRE-family HTH domain